MNSFTVRELINNYLEYIFVYLEIKFKPSKRNRKHAEFVQEKSDSKIFRGM